MNTIDPNADCPSEDVLRLLTAQLNDEATTRGDENLAATLAHVDSCPRCRRRLERLTQAANDAATQPQVALDPQSATMDAGSLDVGLDIENSESSIRDIPGIQLERLIARGGMGAVYAAEQREPVQRKVAVKFVRPDRIDGDLLRRFQRERSLLAAIDHPNVAHLFEAGQLSSGEPYFIMELVEGETIVDHCTAAQMDLPARLAVFLQVCDAIQYLHTKQIVHRDIKPSNILVRRVGQRSQAKIIDFGLAKQLWMEPRQSQDQTLEGQPIGTLRYMSPEQTGLLHKSHSVDARTDVYSLGVVLYELITGDTPLPRVDLETSTFSEILERVRNGELDLPSQRVNARVTEEHLQSLRTSREQLKQETVRDLDWVVSKALRTEPSERYLTVDALALDIRNYLEDRPVTARAPGTGYMAKKFYRREPGSRMVVCVCGACDVGRTVRHHVWPDSSSKGQGSRRGNGAKRDRCKGGSPAIEKPGTLGADRVGATTAENSTSGGGVAVGI